MGKMNWWRAGKECRPSLSLQDERESEKKDRAAKLIAKSCGKKGGHERTWPSKQQIESARHTRAQLAKWGVPWPPPKGWKRALLERDDGFFRFVKSDTYRQLRSDLSPHRRGPDL